MHSTIVVPGLLDWPVSALAAVEKQAPALARLIAAASSPGIEEDGLVALAKTIINRAEEKISLESELRKLRGVEEETDMILPGNLELEEVVDEHLLEKADESLQPRIMSPESQVEGTKEVLVKPESGREPMQKRSGTRSERPTQLLLFAYVS